MIYDVCVCVCVCVNVGGRAALRDPIHGCCKTCVRMYAGVLVGACDV